MNPLLATVCRIARTPVFLRTLPQVLWLSAISSFLLPCTPIATYAQDTAKASVLPSIANESPFICEKKSKLSASNAQTALAKVQRAYEKITSFEANFRQNSYLNALDVSETSQGHMWFERPGKMKWHYQSPEEQIFLLDQGTLKLYQPEQQQVVIDSLGDVVISELPVGFIMGVGKLPNDFTIEEGCQTPSSTLFLLHPRTLSTTDNPKGSADRALAKSLQQLRLLVDSSYLPIGAQIDDISGNTTQILFSNRSDNKSIPPSIWELTLPAGVDINDRRKTKE